MPRRKEKKSFNWMGFLIIVLMVGSAFGVIFYGYSNEDSKFKYNGYTFKQRGNAFITNIDGKQVKFYFHPEDVLGINMSQDIKSRLTSSQVFYFIFDPNDKNTQYIDLLRFELAELAMNNIKQIYFIPGVTNQSDQYNLPVATCNNATFSQPAIYFKTDDKTKITIDNNCIILTANYGTEFLRLRDRLFYTILQLT